MKFGLTDNQYEQLLQLVIKPLKDAGSTVYIFGSRARGKHHPFSDVDILFTKPKDINIDRKIFAIKEQIEESDFPVKVDIVDFENLAKSYVDGVLKDRIEV